jgi:Zn-finger nucleic acid-binding protein
MFSPSHLNFGFFQKVYKTIMASKTSETQTAITESKEDEGDFTLFDIKPLQNYQAELAKKNYAFLIEEYPQYPHAYVELADSLSQTDPVEAIAFYDIVIEMCPYFSGIHLKRGLLCEKLNNECTDKNNLPYNNLDMPAIKRAAKAAQAREHNYRKWYHTKIRKRFFALGLRNTEKLTQDYATEKKMPDWIDPTLSNGAVIDAYMALLATKMNDLVLAKYFLETAVVKYPHDVSSLTNLASMLQYENMPKALSELTKYINIYQDYDTYYTRSNLYKSLGNTTAARSDMLRFITSADKFDMANLAFDINYLFNLLYATNQPYVEKDPPADYVACLSKSLNAQVRAKSGDKTLDYESEIQKYFLHY